MSTGLSNKNQGIKALITEFSQDPLEGVEQNLRIETQALPDPENLDSQDVIIEVRSAGVGWVDLLMTSGQYQHMPPLPYTPGLEYSGVVIWAGTEVNPKQVPAT